MRLVLAADLIGVADRQFELVELRPDFVDRASEVAALETRYRATRAADGGAPKGGQLLDETVRAFEQVSARTQAVRGAGAELSMKEATLADVRAEQARRREDPLQVQLRRLTTF